MRITKRIALIAGVAVLLSTGALVYAFNPQPEPPAHYYGIMTLPAGKHVSLHVSNVKMAVDSLRPAQSMCVAELRLVSACGEVLAQDSGRVSPRESLSLNFTLPPIDPDYPPDPCADPPGGIGAGEHPPDPGRQRLRAQVVFTGPAGHCVSSLEVGDPFVGDPTGLRTGGSGFIHPGSIVGFNPQPDPPGAPIKVIR